MKAVIIGAGPAGLTAAYQLLKNTNIKPVIYEESDVVGGISQTHNFKNNRMDLGGHRFFTKNEQVLNIWKELMDTQGAPSMDEKLFSIERNYPGTADPETMNCFLVRRRVSRIFYLRKFFDYPISFKLRTFTNMGITRTLRAGFGYMKSAAFKRKERNLEDFMINRFGKQLYKMFFEDYTTKVWGRHPRDIDPSWGEQRIKGLSLKKALINAMTKPFRKKNLPVETSLIEEFLYPKKGPGQLYEIMADRVRELGGEIIFNAHIDKIDVAENQVVAVYTNGKRIEGDYFISTMPIKDLVVGMENVPQNVYDVAYNLPYRDFITVGLLLNKMKLTNKTKIKTVNNIVPDCWIYIQERDVQLGRLQIFNNWSPYMVDDFTNKVFIGLEYFTNEGDHLWEMTDDDFINMAIGELVKINIIDACDVVDAVRLRVKKAYPAYFGSYEHFSIVREYLSTIGNLYCIGRNGQHRYNNMDHSMLSAIVAVESIMGLKSKKDIWDVNAEQEYHETANDSRIKSEN